MEDRWNIYIMYAVLFVIVGYLFFINHQLNDGKDILSKNNVAVVTLNQRIDYLESELSQRLSTNLEKTSGQGNALGVLLNYNLNQWTAKNGIDEKLIQQQLNYIATNCSFHDVDEFSSLSYWNSSEISVTINSSKGQLNINILNDSSVKCREFWNYTLFDCVEFCENGTKA